MPYSNVIIPRSACNKPSLPHMGLTGLLFADDALRLAVTLEETCLLCVHITTWMEANRMKVGAIATVKVLLRIEKLPMGWKNCCPCCRAAGRQSRRIFLISSSSAQDLSHIPLGYAMPASHGRPW
jgi:hypothetical protein